MERKTQVLSEKDVEDKVKRIIYRLSEASSNVQNLHKELRAIREVRDLSIIHLAQFKQDYEELLTIYKKMKEYLQNGIPIYQMNQYEQNNQQIDQNLILQQMGQIPQQRLQQGQVQQMQLSPPPMQQYQPPMQVNSMMRPQQPVMQTEHNMSAVKHETAPQAPQQPHYGYQQHMPPSTQPPQLQQSHQPQIQRTPKQIQAKTITPQSPKVVVPPPQHQAVAPPPPPKTAHIQQQPAAQSPPDSPIPTQAGIASAAFQTTHQVTYSYDSVQKEDSVTINNELPYEVKAKDPSFDPKSIQLRYSLTTDAVICSISFNKDGSKFVFANTRTLFIVNSKTGETEMKINMRYNQTISECNPRCIRFSPDGKYVIFGNDDCDIVIFDANNGQFVNALKQHKRKISSIVFTHDGQRMVTAGYDKIICVWNMADFSLISTIEQSANDDNQDDMIVRLAVDEVEHSFIAVGFMTGSIGVYDIDFQEPMLKLQAHSANLMNIAVSPLDSTIATGSADHTVKIWQSRGRLSNLTTLSDNTDLVLALSFSPKTPILFTGSKDETIKGWDYQNSKCLFDIQAHKNTIFEIDHHPTQKTFISCSGEGLVCVWDYTF